MSVLKYTFNFKEFPLRISAIELKKGAVVYRASKTDPKLPVHPRFYSEFECAALYQNGTTPVWMCTFKELRLLDIRMMRNMVVESLLDMRDIKFEKEVMFGNQKQYTFGYYVEQFMLAYGLRPMSENGLANLNKPFQNFGLRMSIFDKDDIAVALLKYIFYPLYAGYVAPQLIQQGGVNFHHEICLFTPDQSIESAEQQNTKRHDILHDDVLNNQQGGREVNPKELAPMELAPDKRRKNLKEPPAESVIKNKEPTFQLHERIQMGQDNVYDEKMDEYLMAFENNSSFQELKKRVHSQMILTM